MLGFIGYFSDLCDIIVKEEEGDYCVKVVFDVFVSCIYKYIGFYIVCMKGVDVIIFIVGVGENSVIICECVLEGFEYMGVYFDVKCNNVFGEEVFISFLYFLVKIIVILIDEEVMIVCDVLCFGDIG